jgi:AbrB family looped-hinge helix DNA binding protein
MLSSVTTKGQVTIPKPIRDRMGIRAQDKVDFVQEGDRVYLVPVRPFKEYRGFLAGRPTAEPGSEREAAKRAVGRRVMDEME